MKNFPDVDEFVFDIKREQVVKVIAVWRQSGDILCRWLPPEQFSDFYFKEQLRPLTEAENVMLRLTGKI